MTVFQFGLCLLLLWMSCCCLVAEGGLCNPGYNYPYSCPRPSDPPEYTKCCRLGYAPHCCEERADHVCASRKGSHKSGGDYDPPRDWYAIWCPQPDDPDDHVICSWTNDKPSCFSATKFAAIFGGVFGGLLLIGIIITVVCCCLCRKGHLVCYKYYDDGCNKKYRLITRATFQRIQAQQAAHPQNQTVPGNEEYPANNQAYPAHNQAYPPVNNAYPPPVSNAAYPSPYPTQEHFLMSNKAYEDPPPSYESVTDKH